MSDFSLFKSVKTTVARTERLIFLIFPFLLFFSITLFSQTFNYELVLRKENYNMNNAWRSKDGTIYFDSWNSIVYSTDKGLTWNQRWLPWDFFVEYGIAGSASLVVLNDRYHRKLLITPDNGATLRTPVITYSYAHQIDIDDLNRIFIADTSSEGRILISTDRGATFDSIFTGNKTLSVGTIDTNIFVSLSLKGIYSLNIYTRKLTLIYPDTSKYLKFAKGKHGALYAADPGGTVIRFTPGSGWKAFTSSRAFNVFYVDSLDHWFDFSSSLVQSRDSGKTWIFRGGASENATFVLDNKVYTISDFGIIRADLSNEPPIKHYFPLTKGNKYQYKKSDIIFNHNQNPTYIESIITFEVDRDTVINGKKYYPYLFSPTNLARTDTAARKIYVLLAGADEVLCDYGNLGVSYQYYDPFLGSGTTSNGFGLVEFNGGLRGRISFGRNTGTPALHQISEFEAIDSVGLSRRYTATGGRFSGTGLKYELLSALVKYDKVRSYTNGAKPSFSYTPTTKIGTSNLVMDLNVYHSNSINSDNYISKVLCLYYYTSQSGSLVSNPVEEDTIALSQAGYPNYKYRLNLPLNMAILTAGGKLHYRFVAIDKALLPQKVYSPVSGYHILTYDPSLNAEDDEKNEQFSLFQCFPNPFSSVTRINFYLPKPVEAVFELYSPLGEKLMEFGGGYYGEGMNQAELEAVSLSSGVYILKFSGGEYSAYQKIVVVK